MRESCIFPSVILNVCVFHSGGSELGHSWATAARGCDKRRTLDDLLACCEALFAAGISRPGLLAMRSSSAGAVPVLSAALQRPEYFHSVVCRVPFAAPLSAMLDRNAPLTEHEFAEWGDPASDPEACAVLRDLDPLATLLTLRRAHHRPRLPRFLVTGGMQDPRVPA